MEHDSPPPPPPLAPTNNRTPNTSSSSKSKNEPLDSPDIFATKIKKLAKYIKKSKHLVVYTGAGVSTSANIPDYRGDNGLYETGIFRYRDLQLDFVNPTLAHMSLVELEKHKILKAVVTSNHDNLHFKSGLNPSNIVEVHGNNYIEFCTKCGHAYRRRRAVPNVGAHITGRNCEQPNCNGILKDNGIDFGQPLPQDQLNKAIELSKKQDVALVLGSSMTVSPFCELPVRAKKMIIVNLQKTPKDKHAKLIIRAKNDDVMKALMQELGLVIPNYVLRETFVIEHQFVTDKWSILINAVLDNQLYILIRGESKYEPPFFIEAVQLTVNDTVRKCMYVTELYQIHDFKRQSADDSDSTLELTLAKDIIKSLPCTLQYKIFLKDFYRSEPLTITETSTQTNSVKLCTFTKMFLADEPALVPPSKPSTSGSALLDAIKSFPKEGLRKNE